MSPKTSRKTNPDTRGAAMCCGIAVLVGALLPAQIDAQTIPLTGTIDGRVVDRAGTSVAGVVVELSGDGIMGLRTTLTSDDGTYRIPALPSGLCKLTFSRPGFRTTGQSGVRVSFNETTTVNAMLDLAASDAVTVTPEILVLDKRATAVATTFDGTLLQDLPGSRTPDSILAAAPSIHLVRFDVGGSSALAPIPFSAYGIAGYNRPTFEGISVSGMNPYGVGLDYGSFEQVTVGAGAYGPEFPSPGVHLQFVAKSGGNRYRGSAFASAGRGGWQSRNIDADQTARGAVSGLNLAAADANRLLSYRDVNIDSGGFIRRDRLWWYASVRDQGTAARQIAFAPEPLANRMTTVLGKVTLQAGRSSRAVLFVHHSENRQPIRLEAFLRPVGAINDTRESTLNREAFGRVWKAEWNAVIGSSVYLQARAGGFSARGADAPNGAAPRFEDLVDPRVSGGNRQGRQSLRHDELSFLMSTELRTWAGVHQVTGGGTLQTRIDTDAWSQGFADDVLHVLRAGRPWEVYLFQAPSLAKSGQRWYATHVNDSWLVTPRFTLNLGLRFDRFRIFLPAQTHPQGRFNPTPQAFARVGNVFDWNAVAPRISGSLSLFGGRTLAKASFGHYWLPPGTDLGFNVNQNSQVWWERHRWSDADSNGRFSSGEEAGLLEQRGGEPLASIDRDLKLAFVREATARIEHQAPGGFALAAGAIWRSERQQGARQRASWPFESFSVLRTVADPGPDGALGTADDGAAIQVYDLPPELVGLSDNVVRNTRYGDSDYFTWEATARRRLGRSLSMLASFSHTQHRDQASGYAGQTVRANEFPATPNDLIHTDGRGRHVFTTWSAKAFVVWDGPWDVRLTPLLRHQSGQPFGRTLVVPLAHATVRVLLEPVGSRRQDHLTTLDLSAARTFRKGDGRQLAVFVDVFNVFNSNAEQNVSWSTNDFLRPLAILPPRIARIGIRAAW